MALMATNAPLQEMKISGPCPLTIDSLTTAQAAMLQTVRQEQLEMMYRVSGRHDPAHPMHGLYTGLYEAYCLKLGAVTELVGQLEKVSARLEEESFSINYEIDESSAAKAEPQEA